MSNNPYAAPDSPIHLVQAVPEIPAEVATKIKNAWVAGVISGSITLLVTLFAISGTSILGYSAWELIDVALIFGLAFGIYRKSRVCAVLMLVYFICAKIMLISENGVASSGIFLALVFVYYFWRGIEGTFQYHRILRDHKP